MTVKYDYYFDLVCAPGDNGATVGTCIDFYGSDSSQDNAATPVPTTPQPSDPVNTCPSCVDNPTQSPVVGNTPAPVTPSPSTNNTPAPITPAPVTPSPSSNDTPSPVTPVPITPSPVTPSPILIASEDICLIGDNLYGDFGINQDSRPLMGTYTPISISNTASILSVDFSSKIYQREYYGEDASDYIFKISNIGWVVSIDASPNTASEDDIALTCFEDELTDCGTYSWYAGYNSYNEPKCANKIISGACDS